MTDLITAASVRQAEHDAMASDVERFLAAGGEIEQIPRGAMVEAGWSPRQRINPQAATKAMRAEELEAARRGRWDEARATPLARDVQERKEPAAEAPKKRRRPAGTGRAPFVSAQAKAVMEALPTHPTVPLLAEKLKRDRATIWAILDRLRKKGLVEADGHARVLATWRVVAQ